MENCCASNSKPSTEEEEKKLEVKQEVKEFDYLVECLAKAVDELGCRIAPIMSGMDGMPLSDIPAKLYISSLGGSIGNNNRSLRNSIDKLVYYMSCLQI